ncbi:MAG: Secretion system C-terminal sorting domain [Bacteroidota bacterium]
MRKHLLVAGAFFAGLSLSAQTLLFSDDFESYTAGVGVAEQGDGWDTWDGSAGVDGEVSTDFAYSGSNSAKIAGTGVDLVLPIGPYANSGKYDVKWKMLVQSQGAYFNLMHQWSSSSTTYQWAVDVFVDGTGTVTWTAGGVEGGDAQITIGEWFDIQVTADQDADLGLIYINGEMIHSWQWSLNNANGAAGLNQIAAVDFYGTNTAGGAGLYYVDDVELWESTGVSVASDEPTGPMFFPNPADENVFVNATESWVGGQVNILDITGKTVASSKILTAGVVTLPTANLSEGIYFVKVIAGSEELTRKLVVRH